MGNCSSCLKKTCCCKDDVESASTLQQPSMSGKQQRTMEECVKLFNEGKDKWDIDALITGINDLSNATLNPLQKQLEKPSTSAISSSTPKTPMLLSFIQSGGTFLKFVNEHIEKTARKDNFLGTSEGAKILSEILQKLGNIHWIASGLAILGYLLFKFQQGSNNKTDCLELIKCMVDLVNHIKKLNIQMPEEEKRLRDAFLLIVEGCIMCASQIQSGKFFKFLQRSVNSEMLKDLHSKINHLYRDLTLTGVIGIQQQLFVTLPLAQPTYPTWAVGLEEPVNQITEMLELGTPKERAEAIVIYGLGGIGKTTLANAVYAKLNLEGFSHTKIEISEDPQKNDFKNIQQQLLKDLFPEYQHGRQITLRNCSEGRYRLTQAFPNKPVFIFIDNALRPEDLEELLPKDLGGLSHCSRILVTARDLSVTDLFEERGLSRRHYLVNTLADEHAEKILCNDPDKLEQIKDEVKKILRICGGITLALEMVGAQLRKQKYRAVNCCEILKALEKGEEIKQGRLSERLINFVYDRLETSIKEAFLDLSAVLYLKNFNRRHAEYMVGETAVARLEEAALITTVPFANSFDDIRKRGVYWEGEEHLIVHNVIRAKGRSMAKGMRIVNDVQSLSRAVEDQKVLQSIKGVMFYRDDESEYMLEESQLSSASNSLRAFGLGPRMSVRGRSSNTFQELRCVMIGGDIPCLPVNLEALPSLAVYEGPIFKEGFSINKLPKSLRYLRGLAQSSRYECSTSEESNPIQIVQNSSLQELDLSPLKNIGILLEGIRHFIELKILWVYGWDEMEELPAQVCQLRSLNKLIMIGWKSLKRLPESFSNLTGLTHLDLGFCSRLNGLCSSFGELRGLRYLGFYKCEMLTELPDSFGQLMALEYLDLSWCTSLTILPRNFGQHTALKCLYLYNCKRLKELPLSFGELRSLEQLELSYCNELKELPSNFMRLTNLQVLKLYGREELGAGLTKMGNTLKILC